MKKAVLMALLVGGALTGCVGWIGPGDGGGAGVDVDVVGYVPAPEVYLFGGVDRGHEDRDAGHRGAESRRAVGHSERPAGRPASGGHDRK